MSDYISKSALIKAVDEQVKGWGKQGIVPSLFSVIAIVQNQPTVDEKEIIRKVFERVVERLEEQEKQYLRRKDEYEKNGNTREAFRQFSKSCSYNNAIEIVKEECGINE